MQHQDWDTIEWRKTGAIMAAEARRKGETETVRRRACGGAMRKVDQTEIGDIKRWGKKRGRQLAAARTKRKLSQAALAQAVNVKPAVIAECESGKMKFDAGLLNRLRRQLGQFDKA